jgi:DNA-binding NtrC family response regulator
VYLLFRKFASDLADKYHSPEIELSEDAEQLLVNYNWPGNIRQLKNLTEQLAVLEQDHLVTGEILRKYLPQTQSNLPALSTSSSRGGSSDFSERDIFYKVLFDMKTEMTDLKKIVLELLKKSNSREEIVEGNEAIIQRVLSEASESETNALTIHRSSEASTASDSDHHDYIIEPEESVSLEENLSLEDKEEELIRKALLRNNGKRKKAAQDLGISERTLYRKIKQYELD